jgi:hypothetical protein
MILSPTELERYSNNQLEDLEDAVCRILQRRYAAEAAQERDPHSDKPVKELIQQAREVIGAK